MQSIPKNLVEWVRTKIIKIHADGPAEDHPYKYQFYLPRPLADWDVFDYWEKERLQSMEDNLKKGMILYDVGAEQGWCSLIYALFVGPENMVLVEPTLEFWPNIKATWERNGLAMPRACLPYLISNRTTTKLVANLGVWPSAANGDLIDRNKYQYIHDNSDNITEVTLDGYIKAGGPVPDALTIDVEGAELLVLKGAKKTLDEHNLLVWLSVHPDLSEKDYNTTASEVHTFMADLGYEGQHLATDHEEHWFYKKTGGGRIS